MASVGVSSSSRLVQALVGGLADPAERPRYTAVHRGAEGAGHHFAGQTATSEATACAYREGDEVCGHTQRCACHTHSQTEREAGITDLLAHRYVSPLAPRYFHFAPGDPDWLTSPTPTPDAWYGQGVEEGGGRP